MNSPDLQFAHQPPPPPPPEEPPPESPPPDALPDELSDAGEGTDSAMPAAATDHAAAPPAPPDRPPPNPLHSGPAGAESLDVRSDWNVGSVDVVVAARSVDQASACSPRPNASTHGYQSSRSAGCGRRSSALKNPR